ncbi:hypothetical protein GCM10012275_40760 [Longimycelium tulufanense]|uniref:DUF1707 domain-containing protein n=1 Tax=Longimycelium tulufanense TaxID=907463 RepID=A0A8J3FX87_9PSEU|nr:DUF1707 domain-containing protein [Longimycelium tulufanense]GGM66026.1 hypothetical protein GCM10012275_40760 [Longimycelium tulufanense]
MTGREPGRDLRVGDTEREQTIAALAEHLGAGRLDIGEYDERCARATRARFRSELVTLFDDLPDPRPGFVGSAVVRTPDATGPPAHRPRLRVGVLLAVALVAGLALLVVTRHWMIMLPLIVVLFLVIGAGRRSG